MVRASPTTSFANVPALQGTAAQSYILWLGRDAPWANEKSITQMPGRIKLSDYTDEEWEALRRPVKLSSIELKAHLLHSILTQIQTLTLSHHPRQTHLPFAILHGDFTETKRPPRYTARVVTV